MHLFVSSVSLLDLTVLSSPQPGFAHLAVSSATARLLRSEWRSEGSPLAGAINSATTLYPVGLGTQTTMQSCASAAKLRSGGPILPVGTKAKGHCRDSATSNRHRRPITSGRTKPNLSGCLSTSFVHCAGRKTTPSGTTPCRTSRHRAIKSLRAKATIMRLREPRAFSVRARNHCAKALSFWCRRNRHANWIMPCRTRPLPDRASPFSRRFLPLSSGEPVRLA